jgi:hypothetical protein
MKRIFILFLLTIPASIIFAQNAGYSLDFDGSNDYVDIDTSSSFRPSSLTVEAWINADTWRSSNWQGTILSQDSWSGTGGQRGWVLRTGDNGRLTLLVSQDSTGYPWKECMSAQLMSTGKWYHVAGIYNGVHQKVYINGVLVQSLYNTKGIHYSTLDKMILGDCTGQLGNRVFDGKIDEVRLWNVALDTNTLRQWMFRPISSSHPQYSHLVSYYKMNESSSTTTYDSSGHSFNGTLNNFSTTPRLSSYAPLVSYTFDCQNEVASIWPVKTIGNSSIMSVTDTISGDAYVVFGHNNGYLNYNTSNKPSYILKRLSRFWKTEKEGSLTGTILFNYYSLDTSNFYTYRLLTDNDTDFSNANTVNGVKKGNRIIAFYNINFQNSTYYTIGAYDYQTPTVTTKSIDEVMAYTAKVSGQLIDSGGLATTRGMCWGTSVNPTTALSTKTTNGNGLGTYQANISGLSSNTTYHVRAYAINSKGTAYGADSVFTTPTPSIPTVITVGKLAVYADSVLYKGNVTSDGFVTVTERGICWSTTSNPTTSSNKITVGNGKGVYTGMLTGMSPSTTYHVRAYAVNSIGTAYGADSTVTTLTISVPVVQTSGKISVYADSVYYRGRVTFSGNKPVTERGFCWSTTSNPTTSSNKLQKGSDTGTFTGMVTGLSPSTTYHIRAYAINSVGTAYGSDSTFTTLSISVPTVITGNISAVMGRSATVSGQIPFDGRRAITQKGFCWSTSANPTTALSTKSTQGGGTASFNYNITGLTPNTTYHVRAYATNAVGTSYGADSTFLTAAPPSVTLDNISAVSYTTASVIATVQSDGRQTVTSRGVCWSTFSNPNLGFASFKPSGTSGTGAYFVAVTGLSTNTKYHIRAYAINSVDTSYSADSTFTTLKYQPPTVITAAPTNITANGAKVAGTVTADGGSAVILRGICWSTNPNPKANIGSRSVNGSGLGSFNYNITTLAKGTTYHVRAFGINISDTGYGGDSIFKTLDVPKVTTDSLKTIDAYKVNCFATVTSDGGTTIIKRGVCWDTKPAPKAKLPTSTNNGSGLGQFVGAVTPLNPGITYYIRAFVINSVDTAYGIEKTYTSPTFATVNTASAVSAITGFSAISGGNVLSGNNITARGVVWDKSANPTIALSTKTSDGSGLGTFTSNISGLSSNTLYHVRAYATNDAGTAYGSDVSFTTADKPTVITGTIAITSSSSASCDGNVTADGRMTVTARGISWSDVAAKVFELTNKTTDGSGTGNFTGNMTGLNPNTLYFACAYAINGVDTAFGSIRTFIITPPLAVTGTTYNINKTSASLSGNVHAMAKTTICYFEYGTSTAYGNSMNATPYTFSDSILKPVSAALNSLTKNTTYHYRLVAESSHGKTYGVDSMFKTLNDNSVADKPAANEAIISITANHLKVEITMQDWENADILVTDLSGREIIRRKNIRKIFVADLPGIQSVYLVKLKIDNRSFVQKVLID